MLRRRRTTLALAASAAVLLSACTAASTGAPSDAGKSTSNPASTATGSASGNAAPSTGSASSPTPEPAAADPFGGKSFAKALAKAPGVVWISDDRSTPKNATASGVSFPRGEALVVGVTCSGTHPFAVALQDNKGLTVASFKVTSCPGTAAYVDPRFGRDSVLAVPAGEGTQDGITTVSVGSASQVQAIDTMLAAQPSIPVTTSPLKYRAKLTEGPVGTVDKVHYTQDLWLRPGETSKTVEVRMKKGEHLVSRAYCDADETFSIGYSTATSGGQSEVNECDPEGSVEFIEGVGADESLPKAPSTFAVKLQLQRSAEHANSTAHVGFAVTKTSPAG